MRKGVVAILAVAIIGALGAYGKSHSSSVSSSSHINMAAASNPTPLATEQTDTKSNDTSSKPKAVTKPSSSGLKDGTFVGSTANTVYGPVQISIVVSGGKIKNVNFLRMPDDRGHTQEVTAFSEPLLKQQTLQKQSAHIDFVSGATQTSEGYQQSLQAALDQAA